MKRNEIGVYPDYYERYINELDDIDMIEALNKYGVEQLIKEKDKLIALGDKVYAPGKWTLKDILQHLIDAERIFAYRALRIARNDKTPLPGFAEDEYAKISGANKRTIDELINEFDALRKSNIILFKSFDKTSLKREGICSGKNISVLAIGFVIAGHTLHHVNVIKEKYLTLS